MLNRRNFIRLTSAGVATPMLASAGSAQQSGLGMETATQVSDTDTFDSIWESSTSSVSSIIVNKDVAYVATSGSIQSYDIETGDPKSVIGSAEGVRDLVESGQHLFTISESGLHKYSKQGEQLWQRPMTSPSQVAATESSVFVVGGFRESDGYGDPAQNAVYLKKINSDGSIAWTSELNWEDSYNLITLDNSVFVSGQRNHDLSDNPYLIRKFSKSNGSQLDEIKIAESDNDYVSGQISIIDSVGYGTIHPGNGEVRSVRFDPVEMTTIWENTESLNVDSTYNVHVLPPSVAGDGVYMIDGDARISKYSKVSGEKLWSGGSIVPHGVTQHNDGILVIGVDDKTVSDEDIDGTGALMLYSASGLKRWEASLGSGSKENQSFLSPKPVPSIDAYVLADVDQSIHLIGPKSVAQKLADSNQTTTSFEESTNDNQTSTTTEEKNSENIDTESPEETDGSQSDIQQQGDTEPRDLIVPGDGLAEYDGNTTFSLSFGVSVISLIGLGYNIIEDD